MILDEIRELKTGPRELRKFGWLVGGVLALLGLIFLLRHRAHYPYFLYPGVVLVVLGLAAPRWLKYVYIAWMSLAIVLGFVVSNVLLCLFFLVIITPLGLVARAFGKDFLRLKLDRRAQTYWMRRPKKSVQSPTEYERQF